MDAEHEPHDAPGAPAAPGAPDGPAARRGPRAGALALVLLLATLAVWARVATLGFVDYDDQHYVTQNEVVLDGLSLDGARWVLTHPHGGNWHPLTSLSHMLDVELFGLRPAGHHVVNALLHVLATLGLFHFLAASTRRTWCAALVAALFALHPLRVESVAWVSERKDVLSGALFFATLLAWRAWTLRGGIGRYLLALAACAAGLAAKPMLVTLPCVLLLIDVWPLERTRAVGVRRLVVEKLPFLALSVVSCLLTLRFQALAGVLNAHELGLGPRLANALIALVRYLGKTLWPADLACFYPHAYDGAGRPWSALELAAGGLLLALLTALALRRRATAVGWLWFLGMLVPVLGVVQVGLQGLADRYTYLPLAGLFAALVYGLTDALEPAAWPRARRRSAAGALALVLAALAVRTVVRIGDWRDSETLWQSALAATERNWVAHANLGRVFLERGDLAAAQQQFTDGVRAKPDAVEPLVNLGVTLERMGDPALAYEAFRQALALDEDDPETRANLAGACLKLGRIDDADLHARRALALEPSLAAAELVLAVVHEQRGEPAQARAAYERALALAPDDALARASLGRRLLADGEPALARDELLRALALLPELVDARINLGLALDALGDRAGARRELERVAATAPDIALVHRRLGEIALAAQDLERASTELERALAAGGDALELQRLLATVRDGLGDASGAARHYRAAFELEPAADLAVALGVALWRTGEPHEAAAVHRRALELDPTLAVAHQNLGLILVSLDDAAEAVRHHRRALELDPTLVPSLFSLAWLLATHPDDALRAGPEALRLAEALVARTGESNPNHLCALAAAHAEVGRFDEAVRWQQRVAELVPGRPLDATRLACYRAGLPYREGTDGQPRSEAPR